MSYGSDCKNCGGLDGDHLKDCKEAPKPKKVGIITHIDNGKTSLTSAVLALTDKLRRPS